MREKGQTTLDEYFPASKIVDNPSLLPIHFSTDTPDLRTVSVPTVYKLLTQEIPITNYLVIDTRFEYEYQGGHIHSALNFTAPESLDQYLNALGAHWGNTPIIVHCEFSVKRGPSFCREFRSLDRIANINDYPHLSYPELYLMEGGYHEFFSLYSELCSPKEYIPMNKKDKHKLKTRKKHRK